MSAFSQFGMMARFVERFPDYVWISLCTIKERVETEDPSGEIIVTYPNDLPGHTDIPCREVPLILTRPTDTESGRPMGIVEELQRHVTLAGYYPLIEPGMGIEIDGILKNILGVENDGSKTHTRMRVDLITP